MHTRRRSDVRLVPPGNVLKEGRQAHAPPWVAGPYLHELDRTMSGVRSIRGLQNAREPAYARAYATSVDRRAALAAWLRQSNASVRLPVSATSRPSPGCRELLMMNNVHDPQS